MQKWYITWGIVLLIAGFARFYRLPARTPFDWDQNRDYQKVESIVGGKFTLLGPIAKGDNGFYLGPMYYYLLVPGFLATSGNPLSFAITSITLDLATIALIFYLAKKRAKERFMLTIVGIIWSLSWFVIENSHISWNVSLLPLWVTLMYAFATAHNLTPRRLTLCGLIAGLSWHIHASLLPLSFLLPIFFTSSKLSFIKKYLYFAIGYLMPILPLLAFDIRHAFFNMRLMLNFASTTAYASHPPISMLIPDVIMKIGKNTLGILTGYVVPSIYVGVLVLLLAIIGLAKRSRATVWCGLIIILNFFFVLALRDLRFPEYYLAVGFLPMLILIGELISSRVALIVLTTIFIGLNFHSYTYAALPFSLEYKIAVVKAVASLGKPVDVRYELSPGREGGIVSLLRLNNVKVTQDAKTKIIFTDKTDGPVIIGGELATDVLQSGGMRVVKYEAN